MASLQAFRTFSYFSIKLMEWVSLQWKFEICRKEEGLYFCCFLAISSEIRWPWMGECWFWAFYLFNDALSRMKIYYLLCCRLNCWTVLSGWLSVILLSLFTFRPRIYLAISIHFLRISGVLVILYSPIRLSNLLFNSSIRSPTPSSMLLLWRFIGMV